KSTTIVLPFVLIKTPTADTNSNLKRYRYAIISKP
ncbi:MAG: hypothetical protein ACI901_001878, partial [Octadecabacter sp.]